MGFVSPRDIYKERKAASTFVQAEPLQRGPPPQQGCVSLLKGRRRKNKKPHQSSRPRAATSCLLANIFSCGSGCPENTTPLPAAEPTRAGAALGLQFRAASGSRVPRLGLRGRCPQVQESPPRTPTAIRSRPRPARRPPALAADTQQWRAAELRPGRSPEPAAAHGSGDKAQP